VKRLSNKERLTARRLAETGYQAQDIAFELGVCRATVLRHTSDIPRPAASTIYPAGRRRRSKKDALYAEWAERVRQGETQAQIASEAGVSRQRVQQALARHQTITGERILIPVRSKAPPPRLRPSFAQRLLSHARREGECWVWKGALSNGTPRRFQGGGKAWSQIAYRAAYQLWRDPSIGGKHLRPVCGDDLCINPYHREPVRT
jgi:predicted transcriptional regulator